MVAFVQNFLPGALFIMVFFYGMPVVSCSTRRRFYTQRLPGQAVVTNVSLVFPLRLGYSFAFCTTIYLHENSQELFALK